MDQYLYFAYLDGGRFGQMLEEALQTIEPMYKQSGIDTQEARETLKLMAQLSPIEKAFVFMVQNLSIGLFLSMTVAVVGMKKPRTNQYNR